MPISGIPMVLENIFESVFKTHNLKTWNLFYEENGDISFRLRLSNMENVHTTPGIGSQSTESYRRKSAKQTARDKDRALKRRRISSQSSKDIEVQRGNSEGDCSYEGPEIEIPHVIQETSIASIQGTAYKSNLTPPVFNLDENVSNDDVESDVSDIPESDSEMFGHSSIVSSDLKLNLEDRFSDLRLCLDKARQGKIGVSDLQRCFDEARKGLVDANSSKTSASQCGLEKGKVDTDNT